MSRLVGQFVGWFVGWSDGPSAVSRSASHRARRAEHVERSADDDGGNGYY